MVDFAIEGMNLGAHPGLRVSREKIRAIVGHFVNSDTDFHLVAFDGKRIVGGIAAVVSEMMFFERREAHVVLCQARGIYGVGRQLAQALRAWADNDTWIRQVQWPEEMGARPGFARLLSRYGFDRVQRVCIYRKG